MPIANASSTMKPQWRKKRANSLRTNRPIHCKAAVTPRYEVWAEALTKPATPTIASPIAWFVRLARRASRLLAFLNPFPTAVAPALIRADNHAFAVPNQLKLIQAIVQHPSEGVEPT